MHSGHLDAHLYDAEGEVLPCVGEHLQIPGSAGQLEVVTSCPEQERTDAVAVICHPHPLHGGSMQNKVVHFLAKTMNDIGLRAVRFNFRGVGASTGEYADGVGEADDLRAVVSWVRSRQPGSDIWLAGFSFGAYVALRSASGLGAARLILVAPPINFFDFSDIAAPPCPWIVVQGEEDEIVPADEVLTWATSMQPEPQIVRFPGVGHFFHGQLNELREALTQRLHPAVTDGSGAGRG